MGSQGALKFKDFPLHWAFPTFRGWRKAHSSADELSNFEKCSESFHLVSSNHFIFHFSPAHDFPLYMPNNELEARILRWKDLLRNPSYFFFNFIPYPIIYSFIQHKMNNLLCQRHGEQPEKNIVDPWKIQGFGAAAISPPPPSRPPAVEIPHVTFDSHEI